MEQSKVKRSGFLRGIYDGLRSSVGNSNQSSPTHSLSGQAGQASGYRTDGQQLEIEERLKPQDFSITKIVQHGFPYQPTTLAFDPLQRIIAIGTKDGSMKILGRPGVDIHVQHVAQHAVIQLIFIVNEGQLISVCADDTLHLWDFKKKPSEIIHSLKFQKERITHCHLPFQSKWLYIGSERGNVHVANIDTFMLSGYVINWNKAIDLSRKTLPGSVIHISDCPIDPNKLLIGFDTGLILLWDLRNKAADTRITYTEGLNSISWHHEGRQFICSHTDGSLTTWNIKGSNKPVAVVYPHAKNITEDLKLDACRPCFKVEWKTVRNGDSFIIFSGGLPFVNLTPSNSVAPSPTPASDSNSKLGKSLAGNSFISTQSLTIIRGKTTTVLEMEHNIIDFIVLCETPWGNDFSEPYAIVVLLYNDLVVIDLTSSGYPCFQNPYTMDLHESPITSCAYFADCGSDLIPAFYSVGYKGSKRTGFSEKEWPINGGEWGTTTFSYPEIVITGHADGSIKFWDGSSQNLQVLYKLKTSKIFEKPKSRPSSGGEGAVQPTTNDDCLDDNFAIERIAFCPESRLLCVASSSSYIIVFRFSRNEAQMEVNVVEVSMNYDLLNKEDAENEATQGIEGLLKQVSSDDGHHSHALNTFYQLQVKSGQHKRPAGFQPELVCLSPWIDQHTPPYRISCLQINASYNLVAYGSEAGLVIVDLVQKCCVLNLGTPELYGSADPYQRQIKVAKKAKDTVASSSKETEGSLSEPDRCKSPTSEQQFSRFIKNPIAIGGSHADKVDCSFSRSRSSSISSMENMNMEPIQCLAFVESFTTKSEASYGPCLWVGTSLGSVITLTITLPETNDNRVLCLQSVLAIPSGNIFRLKGSILSISFVDYTGSLMTTSCESWKDSKSATSSSCQNDKRIGSLSISRSNSAGGNFNTSRSKLSPTSSSAEMVRDTQFVVLVSEKQVRILALPSQTCLYKAVLSETSFAVRADLVAMKTSDSVCLATYLGTGNIVVYSIPSLRPLIDIDFVPFDVRIARTLSFSTNGHGMYLCSPSEINKFTISSAHVETIPEILGTIFVQKDMPEPPKQGFFKGLFGGGLSMLDRAELFGEASGKASRAARLIPTSPSGIDQAKMQSGSLAGELFRVRQGLSERGENLEKLEERTARMMADAEGYRDMTSQLVNKYKDRKWYQF